MTINGPLATVRWGTICRLRRSSRQNRAVVRLRAIVDIASSGSNVCIPTALAPWRYCYTSRADGVFHKA